MSKRKTLKKRVVKKKNRKSVPKIFVKQKFVNAMKRLKQMKAKKQRSAILGASNEFIRDVSGFMNKLRKQPHFVKSKHRNVLNKHRLKLRKLIHAKTPLEDKRLILSQTGGIIPALVPIICALIGAGGGIAGAATSAAIVKG